MENQDDKLFSSLDPLGAEYGRINPPIIDSVGLSAFEGDRINVPKFDSNVSDRFYPVVPNINNLDNPTVELKKNIVGIPPNKPGVNKNQSYNQLKQNMADYARNILKANQDPNQYAKIYSYNAGPDGNAFYKRYQAYGQEKFDEIGFSPLRDNEALFNSRTTKWDDFSRMMTNSFVPLFTRGFVSGPKSLGRMLSGDFTGTDLEDAYAYKEAAAIGQSTKGGVGGFLNNTAMNFAYSAGIISEAVVEEIALTALSVETLGGGAPLLFARTAQNLKRIFTPLTAVKDGLSAVNKTLKGLENIQGARQFWNLAKGFNPLQNTVGAIKTINKADNLTNLAKASKTFGGFYRDVRNINMALSEARLEAGMNENDIYDGFYNQYYAENGKAPSNELQHDMMMQSKKGSLNTLYWNTALIYGSNAITFPNIVGPKGGIKDFVKTTVKELSEVSAGKFGKLGKVVYDQGKKTFAFEKNNLINLAKGWTKNPIHKSIGSTIGYFKANFTEGIQENLQEVISGANKRYYTDTFNSKALQAHNYNKSLSQYDYFADELGKQFSGQGFETFASGFLMGTFAAPLNKSIEYLGIGYNRIFDKDGYKQLKDRKLDITKNLVNTLNNIDVKDFLDSKVFNYGRQDIISKLKETGSRKEALDVFNEGMLEQMDYLITNGSFDSFKEKLTHLQQLTPEEFEDNVKTVPQGEGAKYQAKITDTIAKMDAISNRYKYYNDKYTNPVNLDNLPPKGTPEYQNAIILYNSWNETIKNAVFFNETFEDAMRRKKDIMQSFISQKPLESMSQRDADVIFDGTKLRNEIGLLKNEIDSLKELSDPASKEELKKKQQKLSALEKYQNTNLTFTNFFNRYERASEIRSILQKEKGDVPVTDEEVEAVMDEYFGEFNDDNKIKVLSEYETAFKDLLKTIGDVNNDYIFDEKIDDAFKLLVDHNKLDAESRALVKGINLLHNPGEFLDLVERNQKWMKELYDKRGEFYQKMINEQFDVVIDNALLNALANKSIYISLDDFAMWKKEGIPPSEFYDHARKIVVPDGTPEYDEYYELFEQASDLKAESSSTIPNSLDKVLEEDLNNLENQKEKEINNLPKVQTKVSKGKLKVDSSGQITMKMIQDQLEPNTYAEADYGEEENLIFFKDQSGILRENDIDGDEIEIKSIPIKFTNVEVYTMLEKPDPKYVEEVEKKYEELKQDRINQYTEDVATIETEDKSNAKVEIEPITSETQLEDIVRRAPALYNKLNKEFNEKVIKKLDSEEYVNMTPEQERNLFEKFIQGDAKAKELIENFNNEQKLDKVTKQTAEKEEFEFTYQGKIIKTADLKTIQDLEKMKRRFDKMVKDISDMENPNTADMTNKSKYSIISRDLQKLIDTRTKKEEALDLPEGFRYVEEGEVLPAGNYTTRLSVSGKRTITNAPRRKEAPTSEPSEIEDKKADIEKKYAIELRGQIRARLRNEGKSEDEINKLTGTSESPIITSLMPQDVISLINSYKNSKAKQLENYNKYKDKYKPNEEVVPEIGEIISNDTSFWDNKIEELAALEQPVDNQADIVIVYHHTSVKPEDFNFGSFQRGKDQISQFGDGLNAASTTNSFFVKRYGNPIKGEVKNSDFIIIDANMSQKEMYEMLTAKGFKFTNPQMGKSTPQGGTYVGGSPKTEYDDASALKDSPGAAIDLFNDFQQSNPEVKGVKVINHVIGNENVEPFYVIYNAKSFYGPGTLTKTSKSINIIPQEPQSSDDVDSPTQDDASRKVEVIDDSKRYTINDFKTDLGKVKTIDDLKVVLGELKIKVTEELVAFEDLTAMSELAKEKTQEINLGILKIEPNSLEKGVQLIVKDTIFNDKNLFASANDIVVVTLVNNNSIVVSPLGESKIMTINFDKLNEMFKLKDTIMNTTEQVSTEVSKEDKELLSQSSDLADELLNNPTKLEELENTTSKKKINDLDKDLLDDLKC